MNICVICKYGWIIKGIKDDKSDDKSDDRKMILHDASVVRRWNNGKGIGGIVKEENKDEYTLDAIGDVIINQGSVLFEIPCEW